MNKNEIRENLLYLNNFLGYGNSNIARVFHIAIEEKLEQDYKREEILDDFLRKKEDGQEEIFEGSTSHPGTETTQSTLSYRILNEILGVEDIGYTKEEYLDSNNIILRQYEFGANVNPIACINEPNWPEINIEITGYDNKKEFLNDSWNGTGKFEGITSRKVKMTEFFNKLKARMDQENIYIFIEGNSPYDKLKEIINTVFEIDCESESDRINHLSHRGNNIYSFYGNKIWSIAHPSHGHFNDTDIDNVILYLKNIV